MHFKNSFIFAFSICIWCLVFTDAPAWQSESEIKGLQPQIWKLEIEGNETYSSVVLNEQIASEAHSFWSKLRFWKQSGHELNITTVKKDVIRLRNFYQRRGFYDVKVDYRIEDKRKEWKKKLVFTIRENASIQIGTLDFVFKTDSAGDELIRESRA